MMRRFVLAAVVVALALTVGPLAAAGTDGQQGARGKAKFSLVGSITAVAAGATQLTVKVKTGTKTVRASRGAALTLTVDEKARLRLVIEESCVPVELGDLPVGAKAKVRGRIDRTGEKPAFIALAVKARQPPTAPPGH